MIFVGNDFLLAGRVFNTHFVMDKQKKQETIIASKKINWWQVLLLIAPIGLALFFGPFKQRINEATTWVIILSLLYALINAFCEEFLWRGLFFVHHQGNFFYAVIVPSVWFGIWHYVPLSVQPASIGNLYFILAAIGLGLCWGTVTCYTRSVFWNIISHTMLDWTGIGILFYFS
jgi:membrane protease YdiL (CAAX protease family)